MSYRKAASGAGSLRDLVVAERDKRRVHLALILGPGTPVVDLAEVRRTRAYVAALNRTITFLSRR